MGRGRGRKPSNPWVRRRAARAAATGKSRVRRAPIRTGRIEPTWGWRVDPYGTGTTRSPVGVQALPHLTRVPPSGIARQPKATVAIGSKEMPSVAGGGNAALGPTTCRITGQAHLINQAKLDRRPRRTSRSVPCGSAKCWRSCPPSGRLRLRQGMTAALSRSAAGQGPRTHTGVLIRGTRGRSLPTRSWAAMVADALFRSASVFSARRASQAIRISSTTGIFRVVFSWYSPKPGKRLTCSLYMRARSLSSRGLAVAA